ncbi:MAG: hypothetical protein H6R04_547 [Burkholderiaceae bacterium]|nr:hypothetical protein [Burkholderiaceae bacterium]
MVGAWEIITNPPCALPEKVATAFSEATAGMVGASYTPVAFVAQQLVSGMNYALICDQTLVTRQPEKHVVMMTIYAPLSGKAAISSIEKLI